MTRTNRPWWLLCFRFSLARADRASAAGQGPALYRRVCAMNYEGQFQSEQKDPIKDRSRTCFSGLWAFPWSFGGKAAALDSAGIGLKFFISDKMWRQV